MVRISKTCRPTPKDERVDVDDEFVCVFADGLEERSTAVTLRGS